MAWVDGGGLLRQEAAASRRVVQSRVAERRHKWWARGATRAGADTI